MSSSPSNPSVAQPGGNLLAYLLLLPAIVLAWPSPNPLAGDAVTTEITAAGLALLCVLPAALWLAWERPAPPPTLVKLIIAAVVIQGLGRLLGGDGAIADTLEYDRFFCGAVTALVALLGGAALDEDGRLALVRGLVLMALLLISAGLVEGAPGWGGVLGNSGELSAAALPGAFGAIWLWGERETRWRWVGLFTIGCFITHAWSAPVLASLVVLSAGGFAVALLGARSLTASARMRWMTVAVLAAGGFAWSGFGPNAEGPADSQANIATEEVRTRRGGFEVRQRIWLAALPMIGDHLWSGVGPGQFPVAFPPYRDPAEIELSNWQRQTDQLTEVETLHNDWLTPFIEGGVLLGSVWIAFLMLVGRRAVGALRRRGGAEVALAAAGAGVLLGALFNAPLSFNPAASVAGFLIFGVLLRREEDAPPPGKRTRHFALVAAILAAISIPSAWSMWQHGRALSSLAETTSLTAKRIAVDAALEARHDSVIARTLEARLIAAQEGDLEAALSSWEAALDLRPQSFEAWMQKGVMLARLGRAGEAWVAFERAHDLDAAHPDLLRNRALCAAERGRLEDSLAAIDELVATGHYRSVWLRDLACNLILRGFVHEALPLLERADARFTDLSGEVARAFKEEFRRGGSSMAADAFSALEQLIFARKHAQQERWDDARRSYFQNIRITREYVKPGGPTRMLMEYAAALWRTNRRGEAKSVVEEVEPSLMDWSAMPLWAGESLLEMGFGVDRSAQPGEQGADQE